MKKKTTLAKRSLSRRSVLHEKKFDLQRRFWADTVFLTQKRLFAKILLSRRHFWLKMNRPLRTISANSSFRAKKKSVCSEAPLETKFFLCEICPLLTWFFATKIASKLVFICIAYIFASFFHLFVGFFHDFWFDS